jgi:hypothetical protein
MKYALASLKSKQCICIPMTKYDLQGEPYMVKKAMKAEAENILKVRPTTGMQCFSQHGHCPSLLVLN